MQFEPQLSAAIAQLTPLREELKASIDADAEAYNAVMKAFKDSKTMDEVSGNQLIQTATKGATIVPLNVAEKAHQVAQIAQSLEAVTNPNMKSDLTTAVALARAGITGAMANVEINLKSINDEAFVADIRKRTQLI